MKASTHESAAGRPEDDSDASTAAKSTVAGSRSESKALGVTSASFSFQHSMVLTEIEMPPLAARITPSAVTPTGCAPAPESLQSATAAENTNDASGPSQMGSARERDRRNGAWEMAVNPHDRQRSDPGVEDLHERRFDEPQGREKREPGNR